MRKSSRLIVVSLLALVQAAPALACFETNTTPRPWIWFTSTTTANVAVEGLIAKAGGIGPSDFCAVGFGHSALITGVTSLTVMNEADPTAGPVSLGMTFTPNATTTSDLTTAVPGPTWQGFHAPGVTIPGGTDAALVFSITFAATDYQALVAEMQDFAYIGLDDATAGGALAGSLELEAVDGASELPYCYDDVLQAPEEFCDGASDMGCPLGDSCVDCSVCVLGNQANQCKAEILSSLSLSEKYQLKCYAKAAKLAQIVDPMCLSGANDAALLWMKYVPSCPQTLPASGTVQGYLDSLGSALVPMLPVGSNPPGSYKCAANKFKAASLRAVSEAKCYSKAYHLGVAVDPVCLSRADTKYQTKFAHAELPGLCDAGNIGNASAVATRVDQFVISEIVGTIPPP